MLVGERLRAPQRRSATVDRTSVCARLEQAAGPHQPVRTDTIEWRKPTLREKGRGEGGVDVRDPSRARRRHATTVVSLPDSSLLAWGRSGLAHTKLHRPSVRRKGLVPTTDLVARLQASRAIPLVSVMAPTGYGKTTLLAQWAAKDRRPFAWLTLDERDNDPTVLLTSIAAALDHVRPVDPTVPDTRGIDPGGDDPCGGSQIEGRAQLDVATDGPRPRQRRHPRQPAIASTRSRCSPPTYRTGCKWRSQGEAGRGALSLVCGPMVRFSRSDREISR